MSDTNFSFSDWLATSALNDATKAVLEDEDLISDRALRTLSEADMKTLKLTVGQRGLLRVAVNRLHPASAHSVEQEDAPAMAPANLKSLAKDKELNALLKEMGETHLTDLLTTSATVNPGQFTTKGEKPLLIPDFVAQPKGAYVGDTDEIVAVAGLTQLVMRGRKKPALDQITLPQWLSAACRILLQLITQEKLTPEGICQYLEYTAEVGDLCQTYTTSSVMLLDNAHRLRQSQSQCKWTDSNQHSRSFYLERRQPTTMGNRNNNKGNTSKARRALDTQGREICVSYNQTGGCYYPNCKYQHVCLVSGCGANHPKHQHDSTPPRFRGQQSTA